MHEQEGMIQLSAAAKRPQMDILLQQIAESYLLAHALLSNAALMQQTDADHCHGYVYICQNKYAV